MLETKKRETILIFTSKEKAHITDALKMQLSVLNPELLIIIFDVDELYVRVLPDFFTSQLKLQLNITRIGHSIKTKKAESNINELRKYDLEFKNQISYRRMENIFLRYSPKAVILTSVDGLEEATSVRNKFNSNIKVFLYDTELLINKQFLNPYVDKLIVSNQISANRVNENEIDFSKILTAGIAFPKDYEKPIFRADANKKLGLVDKKRTLLFLIDDEEKEEQMKSLISTLSNHLEKYNILIWSRKNEAISKVALIAGYKVYNQETTDFNILLSAANVIITRPNSFFFTIAFKTQKLCVSFGNANNLEKAIVEEYEDKIVECKTLIRLNNFLTLYPNEDYEKKRLKAVDFEYNNPAQVINEELKNIE